MKPQDIWNDLCEELKTITDALGCPIDKGIKETVVALQAHGFKTKQSCEGHTGHGCCYPWVHIELPRNPQKATSERKRLQKLIDEFYDERYGEDAGLIIWRLRRSTTLRLQSRGGKLLDELPKEIVTRKVQAGIKKRYGKEIDSFQRFLKKKFFNR